MSPVSQIVGTITLEDGSTSRFMITMPSSGWSVEPVWSQWDADTARLGQTVDVVTALAEAVADAEYGEP